jgi:xylan 1,4-beta-xylosidase
MYKNPILPGFFPDPSVTRVGDDYYLVTSTFEYFPGVPIFHSRDLVNWRQLGHCLTRTSQLPLGKSKSSEGIFAPTIRYFAGTFYVITTNLAEGGNFFVTATDPSGPWSEPIWIRESSRGVDPSLFFDDDGRVFYTRHGGGERGGVVQAEIDVASGRLANEARLIWTGTGGVWPEGPHLYKFRSKYYLLISEGGTGYDHCLTVARADSPFGPFEPCPRNPILTHRHRRELPIQATGHGDLVSSANGSFWMVLLGVRPVDGRHHHLGRETFLAPLSWDEAGWPVIHGGKPLELEMQSDGLPAECARITPAARDDFDGAALAPIWNFLRSDAAGSYSLGERAGFLRLFGGTSTLDELGTPAFVGRRQQHHHCRVSATLEFAPRAAGEEAGLSVRANEANHYELFVSGSDGVRHVTLRARIGGKSSILARVALAAGAVELSLRAYPERYDFSFRDAAGSVRALGSAPTAALSSESAGGFTGVYFGMFATRSGAEPMPPADFDWFDYHHF